MSMKQRLLNFAIFLISFTIAPVCAVTIVYNLRVAGAAKRQAIREFKPGPEIVAAIPFFAARQRYNGGKQKMGGLLGTFVHIKPPWYFKVDFAAARVAECTAANTYFARTQTDDILLSTGYILPIKERAKLAFSALLGIPTHTSYELEPIQFGIAHVGTGAQLDGSYIYTSNLKHSLVGATRFLHFFPRNTSVTVANTCQTFNLHLGNTVDLFIAQHSNLGRHSFEVGYNPIFNFGAFACPAIQAVTDNAHAIRNTFFGNYRYNFLIHKHPSAILGGISYAYDRQTTDIGFRNTWIVWAAWGVNF